MTPQSPIFIVGMPRSGTTLLRSLLNQHPDIAIAPETHFLSSFVLKSNTPDSCWQEYASTERFGYLGIKATAVSSRLNQNPKMSYRAIFDAILREYADLMKKPIYGEKTPAHYEHLETIFQWYPEARVVWLVRDPRAVSASYQYVYWHDGGVTGPAFRWRASMKKLSKWSSDSRVLIVKYEDLVLASQRLIESIFEFLNVKPIPVESINASRKEPQIEDRGQWARKHFKTAAGPIKTDSLTKWKNELTSNQIILIETITHDGMSKMNYVITNKLSIINYINIFIEIVKLVLLHPRILINKLINFK